MWRVHFVIFLVAAALVTGCQGAVEPGLASTATATATTHTPATLPVIETSAATGDETATPAASPVNTRVAETPASEATVTPMDEIEDAVHDLPQVAIAIEDLADRLDVAPESIEVLEVEARTWPDTSMGCPHPDMAYIQVPQDGLLIRLRADGQIYDYHSGGTREPFLCEQTTPGKSTPISIEPMDD